MFRTSQLQKSAMTVDWLHNRLDHVMQIIQHDSKQGTL